MQPISNAAEIGTDTLSLPASGYPLGDPFLLALPERLLMGLMYLRLYVGQNLLSYLFDLDQSNVSRELNTRLLPLLLQVLPVPLRDAPLRHLAQDKPDDPNAEGSVRRQ